MKPSKNIYLFVGNLYLFRYTEEVYTTTCIKDSGQVNIRALVCNITGYVLDIVRNEGILLIGL